MAGGTDSIADTLPRSVTDDEGGSNSNSTASDCEEADCGASSDGTSYQSSNETDNFSTTTSDTIHRLRPPLSPLSTSSSIPTDISSIDESNSPLEPFGELPKRIVSDLPSSRLESHQGTIVLIPRKVQERSDVEGSKKSRFSTALSGPKRFASQLFNTFKGKAIKSRNSIPATIVPRTPSEWIMWMNISEGSLNFRLCQDISHSPNSKTSGGQHLSSSMSRPTSSPCWFKISLIEVARVAISPIDVPPKGLASGSCALTMSLQHATGKSSNRSSIYILEMFLDELNEVTIYLPSFEEAHRWLEVLEQDFSRFNQRSNEEVEDSEPGQGEYLQHAPFSRRTLETIAGGNNIRSLMHNFNDDEENAQSVHMERRSKHSLRLSRKLSTENVSSVNEFGNVEKYDIESMQGFLGDRRAKLSRAKIHRKSMSLFGFGDLGEQSLRVLSRSGTAPNLLEVEDSSSTPNLLNVEVSSSSPNLQHVATSSATLTGGPVGGMSSTLDGDNFQSPSGLLVEDIDQDARSTEGSLPSERPDTGSSVKEDGMRLQRIAQRATKHVSFSVPGRNSSSDQASLHDLPSSTIDSTNSNNHYSSLSHEQETSADFVQINPALLPVTPVHYKLNLDLQIEQSLVRGKLELECLAHETVTFVSLFYSGTIHNVEVRRMSSTVQIPVRDIQVLGDDGSFSVPLPVPVEAGVKFTLLIAFKGEISSVFGRGVYSCVDDEQPQLQQQDLQSSRSSVSRRSASRTGSLREILTGHRNSFEPDLADEVPDKFIGTHFEPQWCREAFPCIDHPSAKAKFTLSLVVPGKWETVSCTPELRSEYVHGSPPRRRVCFGTTPVMPAYSFGFWSGPFAKKTVVSQGSKIPITMYGVPSRMIDNHMDFALFISQQSIDFFSRLFPDTPYALPKLSLICMPKLYCMGMENFGAISIHQGYAYVGPNTAINRRLRIERLFAHEICHQWYGNMVTPANWEELWLKEGMARFLEFLAIDHIRSTNRTHDNFQDGWDVWVGFVREVMAPAMRTDSGSSSHPVVAKESNRSMSEIVKSFDTITYGKGAFILRMLSLIVGVTRFTRAIARLVEHHQFGNSTRHDLWASVEEICANDDTKEADEFLQSSVGAGPHLTEMAYPTSLLKTCTIGDVMESWLKQTGFPRLLVTQVSEDDVKLAQACDPCRTMLLQPDKLNAQHSSEHNVFVRIKQLTQSQLHFITENYSNNSLGEDGEGEEHTQLPPGHHQPHWIIPLALRIGYSWVNEEGQVETRTKEECVWMEPGISQVDILFPPRTTFLADLPQRSRREARRLLFVNCDMLAFVQVVYGDRLSRDAVLNSLRSSVLSPVDAVGFVHNEMLGYIHANQWERSAYGYRLQQVESILRDQPASIARTTILEFVWGLKAHAATKVLVQAQKFGVKSSSNGHRSKGRQLPTSSKSPTSPNTPHYEGDESGEESCSSDDEITVRTARFASSSTGSSESLRQAGQRAVSPQELLISLDSLNVVLKDIESSSKEEGVALWAVENSMMGKTGIKQLADRLWELLVAEIGSSRPHATNPRSSVRVKPVAKRVTVGTTSKTLPRPRLLGNRKSVNELDEVYRAPNNNPAFKN